MNIENEILKAISSTEYRKSDKDFKSAIEMYKTLEKKEVIKPRGYTIASKASETSFKCYYG